ncbi:hypothetical protein HU200_030290 [Digitaria exilis]|uniref:Pentatricopeptide repeat-containing protein n=1 Tax=Digitaria exilis TaxID=1010633 RepID=A0A835EQZ2_9POAL|nr:hypothetical protein HU200_030290 [Digitaria exilis]
MGRHCVVHAEMLQLGIEPSIVTYNTLLDSFLKEGREDKAAMVLKEMETQGIGCLPNDVTYNVVISWLTRKGELGEAVELVDWMRLSKKASSFTYNMLIRWVFRKGFLKKVEALQLVMRMKPDCFAYNTRICAELALGSASKAFQLREVMMLEGISSDIVTYNILIDGLCKTGNLKDAEDLQMKMLNDGLQPDCITYTCLIHAHCGKRTPKRSKKVFLQDDLRSFATLSCDLHCSYSCIL